jgi:hypothetical protein
VADVSKDAPASAQAPLAGPKKKRKRATTAHFEGPSFARHFPREPELDRLVAAFERGNYALVREQAPRLMKATARDDVRLAARELRRRIDPDPLASFLLVAAAGLLAFLAYFYFAHTHGGGG